MNTFALLLGLVSAAELPTPQYQIDLAIYQGDPLGSKAAGTLNVICQPTVHVAAGQTGYVQVGQDWPVPGPNGTTTYRPIGVTVRVKPTPGPGGTVRLGLDFQLATVIPSQEIPGAVGQGSPAFNVETVETTVAVKPGVLTRVRMWAKGPADQTWVEVTVRPVE